MSGIDKIISQIESDAKKVCDDILSGANAKADAILKDAAKEAASVQKISAEKTKTRLKDISDRAASAVSLERKKCDLLTKQNAISVMLKKARENAAALDDRSYFDLILKMIERNSQPQDGVIRFNASDLARIPTGFETEINKVSAGNLKLSTDPIDIDAGFVLIYGGIEENCSFEAVMKSREEELSDKASALLFREG